MDARFLGTLFWAALVNTVFLIFSLVRVFAAKQVRYSLLDLFHPSFYKANPVFILLMIIGPVTFISDLMVFSAAGNVSTNVLGLFGLTALNLVGVIFGFIQFVLVNVFFRTEQVSTYVWILLFFWFLLVMSGTLIGTVIMGELVKQ